MDLFANLADMDQFQLIAIAGGLGALLGLEREIAGKPAGLRTHIFVAAGAALLIVLSRVVLDDFQEQEGTSVIQTDPVRVIEAIVVGISFLGAGTIIHDDDQHVEGLTTAASIFLTAGIGITAALDRIGLAIAVTLSALGVLLLVGILETWLHRHVRPERFDSRQSRDR